MFDIYKEVSVMGSTGSIGTQTLEVIRSLNRKNEENAVRVTGLSAGNNFVLLAKQAKEFGVRNICVGTQEGAEYIKRELRDISPRVFVGDEGLSEFAQTETELLVTGIVGMRGLVPTVRALEKGIDIALANKETLVTGGNIVMETAEKKNALILPVDSEHGAVFQCLRGHEKKDVERLILTASGGPFRGLKRKDLEKVSVEQALGHPTWKMGKKITIDCATMMNKGLEVIEASRLFGFGADKVSVLVHPQSIVHSMVEYKDGSVKAQLSVPDMKLPIIQAITYPDNGESSVEKLNLAKISGLTFEEPDTETFKCLKLAYEALKEGGTAPAILNGANEEAVNMFLCGMITFTEIGDTVEAALCSVKRQDAESLEGILEADRLARKFVNESRK